MAIISNENGEIDEKARADANNANNIRNAAEVAIASKNPYATAIGGAVKGLDTVTKGKSTDAFGKLATRTTQRVPGGKKLQNASNKLNESGVSDKIGQVAAAKNGMDKNSGPKNTPKAKNDVGERNLQNSLRNKSRNLFNNRRKGGNEGQSDNSNTPSDSGASNNEESSLSGGLSGIGGKLLKIKIIIIGSIILFFIVIIGLMVLSLFGVSVTTIFPSTNSETYETEEFVPMYDDDTPEHEAEIKYYDKLKKAREDYKNQYDKELKTNFVHAILIYLNYITDMEGADNEESGLLIDYEKMTNKVDEVVELMKPTENEADDDYEIGGTFYKKLKESAFFKDYYKEPLKEMTDDEILEGIFELAEDLGEISAEDEEVITEETKVTVKDSSSSASSKSQGQTYSMSDYLANSVYSSTVSINNSEMVKAYTIAYSTNIAAQNKKLSISSNTATMSNDICNVKLGCSYNSSGKLVDGPGERSSQNNIFYNGKYYYRQPLNSSEISSLNSTVNSVLGKVLVAKDGTYPTLDMGRLNGLGNGTYESILKQGYGNNYTIKNIGEDSYVDDSSYGSNRILTTVTFYDQNDYSSYQFCGKNKETIKTSGCGTTSMAMIVSTYEKNSKYDPVYMTKEAHNNGYCGKGITGTSPGFFKKEAKKMGYKYVYANKKKKQDLNLVLSHLAQGHLVIAHMGPGHFTNGGHYMVLGGVDPVNKQVYVYDPYNKVNKQYRGTGNGWHSFNSLIVKEAFGFYIIWKG